MLIHNYMYGYSLCIYFLRVVVFVICEFRWLTYLHCSSNCNQIRDIYLLLRAQLSEYFATSPTHSSSTEEYDYSRVRLLTSTYYFAVIFSPVLSSYCYPHFSLKLDLSPLKRKQVY